MERSGIIFAGKRIFLILIGVSISLCADFRRSDNIVIDNDTNLQWADVNDKNNSKTWQLAIDYCQDLTLGGYSDWRLPNINELKSLVDDTKYNPSIDRIFQNIKSYTYWSSTTSAKYSNNVWTVYLYNGGQGDSLRKNLNYHVCCVRAGEN